MRYRFLFIGIILGMLSGKNNLSANPYTWVKNFSENHSYKGLNSNQLKPVYTQVNLIKNISIYKKLILHKIVTTNRIASGNQKILQNVTHKIYTGQNIFLNADAFQITPNIGVTSKAIRKSEFSYSTMANTISRGDYLRINTGRPLVILKNHMYPLFSLNANISDSMKIFTVHKDTGTNNFQLLKKDRTNKYTPQEIIQGSGFNNGNTGFLNRNTQYLRNCYSQSAKYFIEKYTI